MCVCVCTCVCMCVHVCVCTCVCVYVCLVPNFEAELHTDVHHCSPDNGMSLHWVVRICRLREWPLDNRPLPGSAIARNGSAY